MEFKEGIYENLDYPTYDSIPAWRSHDLTSIAKCPFTWKNRTFNNSPALFEGRVMHTVFLEHYKFAEEFAIEPPVDRRTKVGKAEYAEWLEELGDKDPVKQDLYDTCMERREVVSDYIPKGKHHVELTLCWIWNGQPCKGKLDWHTGSDVWDYKSCRDASPRGGCRAVGLPTEKFYFLAQEKQAPYPFGVYTLSDEAIAYADAQNEQAMAIGIKCREQDLYLPYNQEGIKEFGLADLN